MLKLSSKKTSTNKILAKNKTRLEKAKRNLEKRKYSEFLELPKRDYSPLLKEITQLKNKFSDIVIVGMGGSILGGQMLFHTLKDPNHNLLQKSKKGPSIHFIDTLDPRIIKSYEDVLDKKNTLFIFVSKSGGTLETTALFDLILQGAKKWFGANWQKHMLVMTENEKGHLHERATKENLKIISLPKFVGGRYSLLTESGIIPAHLMGLNTTKLQEGAKNTKDSDRLACLLYEMYKKGKETLVLFPYISGFEYFNKWVIQLIAESLGKTSKVGPLAISLLGPSDQHSVLQLLLDGPKDKWVMFFELTNYKKDYKLKNNSFTEILKAEQKGTSQALDDKKIPNLTFTLQDLNEESLGKLAQTFMTATALAGEMLNINPFNQPAVELGKKKTKAILK